MHYEQKEQRLRVVKGGEDLAVSRKSVCPRLLLSLNMEQAVKLERVALILINHKNFVLLRKGDSISFV